MRFIGKKSVCAAAIGLLLAFYFVRKRKAQDGRVADAVKDAPQSQDAPNPNAIPDPDAPPVSDSSDADPRDASATNADVPNEPPPSAPPITPETSTERKDVPAAALTASLDAPTLSTPTPGVPPADDGSDTDPDDDVVSAQPDISVYENAFDTPPSSDEPSSDSEGISDIPPNTVKPPKTRQTRQTGQSGQSHMQRRQAGNRPRMYKGRRIRTGAYYPPLSKPTEKASLRCRETAGAWEIFVALPEDREAVKASYVEDELGLDILDDNEIRLIRYDGVVSVRYENDDDLIQLADASMDKPLFFRMRRNWEGEGWLVNNPSAGYILAIAPQGYTGEWGNVESDIEPEDCGDSNFQARFLFLEGAPPGAITPMRLEGATLRDDSDTAHHGELYIGAPPELSVDPQISVAVIVEETGERADNKWVQDFQPHNQSIMSVLDGREGRLSVRTYLDGTRQDTRTFRYFPGLSRITLDGQPHAAYADTVAFPDKGDGTHRAIELRFVADNDDLLRPTEAKATVAAATEPADLQITDAGVVVIPPLPSIDAVKCEFPNRALITLALPRVWWRKTGPDGAVGDWSGAVFSIPRSEFAKTRLVIKTPTWVSSISMGFGDKTDSEFSAVRGKARVELISFENAEELEGTRTLEEDLLLNIRINGQSAPIVRVLADPIVGAATDKALLNLLNRYSARVSAAQTDMVSIPDRFKYADGVAMARIRLPNLLRLNEGDIVIGEVVRFDKSLYYELEITGEHGQEPVRGVLPLDEMTTMAKSERDQIRVGHNLLVVVVIAPDGNLTRALLSVDRLADYEQGESRPCND